MGQTKGAYNPEFPAGTLVRIADLRQLEDFRKNWRFHHPLTEEQLAYAAVEGRRMARSLSAPRFR